MTMNVIEEGVMTMHHGEQVTYQIVAPVPPTMPTPEGVTRWCGSCVHAPLPITAQPCSDCKGMQTGYSRWLYKAA